MLAVYAIWTRPVRRSVVHATVLLLVAAATLAPWVVRNYRLTQAIVPTSVHGGTQLWYGSLQVGHTLTPRHVIDAGNGSRTDSGAGHGVLVSFESVADVEQKAKLAKAYGAHAVDMEAATVARAAEAHGIKFLACKVISDANDSRMPPIGRFIGDDGRFHALKFVVYVAFRPRLWASVGQLARDSVLAAGKLCEALSAVTTEAHAQAVSSDPRAAANLKT